MPLSQSNASFRWDVEGLAIGGIVVAGLVVTMVSRVAVRRFRRRLEGSPTLTGALNLQRVTTLTAALSTAAVVLIWTVAVLLALGELDINLAPLLASAGVAGVALGFGAQSVVRDALSGFFILLENQFGVGDVAEITTSAGRVAGKVEGLTLRVTSLRAFDGTLHMVPNGYILVVSNKSRGWGRAIVDVRLAYDEDVERVRVMLDDLFEEIEREGLLDGWLTQRPSVLGMETLSEYGVVIRATADTRASKRFDAERRLRELITARLAREGIRVPVPPAAGITTPERPAGGGPSS